MSDDIDLNSDLESLLGGSGLRRRSSDVLNDRLAQVRLAAEQSDKQRHLSFVLNNELRGKLDALRQQLAQDNPKVDDQSASANNDKMRAEVETLRRELEGLREQSIADLKKFSEPTNSEPDAALSRELELQAALQAERQQAAIMRKTLEEREQALRDLENQCESLGNDLEDREREMDHLTRKIEQVQTKQSSPGSGSKDSFEKVSIAAHPTSGHALGISELFNTDSFDHGPRPPIPWKTIGIVLASTLFMGATIALGVLLWLRLPPITVLIPKFNPPNQFVASAPVTPVPRQNVQPSLQVTPVIHPNIIPTISDTTNTYVQSPSIRDNLNGGGQGPSMLKLPSGTFYMGNKFAFTGSELEEQPAHAVTIKSFYIASCETTFDEYDRFAKATGRPLPDDAGFGRLDRPVINVSWEDAQAYSQWLSSETGHHYYVPSESQWEYAARGGTGTNYWWGNDKLSGHAICFSCGTQWDMRSTAPVGSLKPNPFGLYDTAGNVTEWVQDCYNSDYKGAPTDGSPWLTGDCSQHIVRGGAFNKPLTAIRSNSRFKLPTDSNFNMLGFRVARD